MVMYTQKWACPASWVRVISSRNGSENQPKFAGNLKYVFLEIFFEGPISDWQVVQPTCQVLHAPSTIMVWLFCSRMPNFLQ